MGFHLRSLIFLKKKLAKLLGKPKKYIFFFQIKLIFPKQKNIFEISRFFVSYFKFWVAFLLKPKRNKVGLIKKSRYFYFSS
jgi:hypothetical protein